LLNAKIFFVEDDPMTQKYFPPILEDEGHQVVLQARTLQQALSAIESGKLEKAQITLAIVDGNLTENDSSCSDGYHVAKAIREKCPTIKIVAFTGASDVGWGDFYFFKGRHYREWRSFIAEIPEA
jgi:CheY-like chemotaxis protein